jgi:non-canonical (house-cleaning) NTP pyrophosphatase
LDLTDFWGRYRGGVEVAVDSIDSEVLLGVRDGFVRYFHEGLERPLQVAVRSTAEAVDANHIPLTDEEMLRGIRSRAARLRRDLGDAFSFYAASTTGLHSLYLDRPGGGGRTEELHFVRSWTALEGPNGGAVGGSGSLQLPPALIAGIDAGELPFAVPGRRRRGGMMGSLTGGLQTRRSAVAQSTLHAISTLLYGVVEARRRQPTPSGGRR